MATVIVRWLVVAFLIFILSIYGGVYVTTHVLTKVYTAKAQIQVKSSNKEGAFDSVSFQPEFQAIQSPDVLLPVINGLDLRNRWARKIRKANQDPLSTQEALDYMRTVLKIDFVRGTDIVVVTAASEVPQEAADMANGVVSEYKNRRNNEDDKRNNYGIGALSQEIAEQQKVVDRITDVAENLRAKLQAKGPVISSEGNAPANNDLEEYRAAIQGLKQQRDIYDALMVRRAKLQADKSLVRFISAADTPQFPSQPNRALCIVITAMTALFLSIGIASAVEIVFALGRRTPGTTRSS